MKRLKLTDIPLIIFGTAFVYYATIFIFTGVNMLAMPSGDPGRWVVLIALTVVSSIVCMFGKD